MSHREQIAAAGGLTLVEFDRILALPEAEYRAHMDSLRAQIDADADAAQDLRLARWDAYRAALAAGIDVADEEIMSRWYAEHR